MLRTGAVLHGTYRIDSYLSSGGFGNTYVATHINFNEKCAVKEFFMKGVSERDANSVTVSVSNATRVNEFIEQMAKFKKEALRLRHLQNDHIVRVHDLFEENGTAYYVMDYIDGENLKDRLARTKSSMSEAEVNGVLRQILDALSEVHAQGIWHMDLKPANVMLDSNGVVKLIDFGASKQFDIRKGGALSTSAVTFTNGYAPIEQMERSYEKFGPWTDFYALGATLYNLLTSRRPPMPSDINDDITADKRIALPMPGTISTRMRDLVLWLMRPNRVDRPSSVEQIFDYLDNPSARVPFLTTDPGATVISRPDDIANPAAARAASKPAAKVASGTSPATPKKMSSGVLVGIIAAAVVLLGIALFFMLSRGDTTEVEVPGEEMVDTMVVEEAEAKSKDMLLAPREVTNEKMTIPMGSCIYSGRVNREGKPDGYGTAVFSNGDRCWGKFVNGDLNGEDVRYYYFDGDRFMGTVCKNNCVHGRYTRGSDGSYFEGYMKDNLPDEERGQWYNSDGSRKVVK